MHLIFHADLHYETAAIARPLGPAPGVIFLSLPPAKFLPSSTQTNKTVMLNTAKAHAADSSGTHTDCGYNEYYYFLLLVFLEVSLGW